MNDVWRWLWIKIILVARISSFGHHSKTYGHIHPLLLPQSQHSTRVNFFDLEFNHFRDTTNGFTFFAQFSDLWLSHFRPMQGGDRMHVHALMLVNLFQNYRFL